MLAFSPHYAAEASRSGRSASVSRPTSSRDGPQSLRTSWRSVGVWQQEPGLLFTWSRFQHPWSRVGVTSCDLVPIGVSTQNSGLCQSSQTASSEDSLATMRLHHCCRGETHSCTQEAEAEALCEFKTSLVYRVSSRHPGLLHRETLSRKTNKQKNGAGEMAQRLRALPALSEVLSSIPSKNMVVHNHL